MFANKGQRKVRKYMGRLKTFLKIHLKKFMSKKEISKDDAQKILQEYLVKTVEITEQEPNWCNIQSMG